MENKYFLNKKNLKSFRSPLRDRSVKVSLTTILNLMILVSCMSALLPVNAQPSANHSISISPNGHYFIDRKGNPFLWIGDTEWELFNQLTAKEAGSLMIERKKQGFNAIQVMVTGVFPEWADIIHTERWKGTKAWINNDPLKPDEDYFRRVDSIVAIAEKSELLLIIGVYHARDVDAGRINVQNAYPWAKWLATRYRNAGNIIWSMYPHAVEGSIPVIRATVKGILEGDGGSHLITMHPDPSPKSSSFMNPEPWLNFNTLQTWSRDYLNFEMVKADYEKTPVKPVVNGEARYEEEDSTTPFQVRRSAYWSYLAGGFYSYGHRDNWKSPHSWRTWYNTPGALQMKILGELLNSLEWWKMIPDQTILLSEIKGNVAARSADGDWIIAYITNKEPVAVNMHKITVKGSATAMWINPVTGKRSKIGSIDTTGSHTFYPPEGEEDAVLLIK